MKQKLFNKIRYIFKEKNFAALIVYITKITIVPLLIWKFVQGLNFFEIDLPVTVLLIVCYIGIQYAIDIETDHRKLGKLNLLNAALLLLLFGLKFYKYKMHPESDGILELAIMVVATIVAELFLYYQFHYHPPEIQVATSVVQRGSSGGNWKMAFGILLGLTAGLGVSFAPAYVREEIIKEQTEIADTRQVLPKVDTEPVDEKVEKEQREGKVGEEASDESTCEFNGTKFHNPESNQDFLKLTKSGKFYMISGEISLQPINGKLKYSDGTFEVVGSTGFSLVSGGLSISTDCTSIDGVLTFEGWTGTETVNVNYSSNKARPD